MTYKRSEFFLPYQKKWINDASRIKIMEKSRQIGLSWATAYSTVRKHSIQSQKLDSWISSRDEIQAKLFLQDCKKFSKAINSAASNLASPILNEDSKQSSFTLAFSNNTHIHSLSSNPDAQAGKRGSRILDEFALHPDPELLYSIAYPGITWGGQLEIISTHRGVSNFFHKLIQETTLGSNPKNISHHKVTLEDALNQGFLQKLKEKLPSDDDRQFMNEAQYFDFIKNACADHESFLQEYMCQPADESSFFLHPNLIESALFAPETNWELSFKEIAASPSDFFLGIDLARHHDLTVFWLLESIDDLLLTRNVTTLKNTPFSTQEDILYNLLQLPNIRRTCIDQTGLGRQFAERAIQRFGSARIEGINFTNSTKEALAYPLRTCIENKTLKIPNQKEIIADLRAIKKESTIAGNIRFSADRGQNGHADRFWALALAVHASNKAAAKPYYQKIFPKPHTLKF